jgi:hypothetical protein
MRRRARRVLPQGETDRCRRDDVLEAVFPRNAGSHRARRAVAGWMGSVTPHGFLVHLQQVQCLKLSDDGTRVSGGDGGIDIKRVRELMRDVRNRGSPIATLPDIARRGIQLVDHSCLLIEHHRLPVNQARSDIRPSRRASGKWEP